MFKATLKLNNQEYEAKGEILAEVFDEMVYALAWPKSKELLKTSGLITVKQGKQEAVSELRLFPLKRFINSKIMREIWAKRMLAILK